MPRRSRSRGRPFGYTANREVIPDEAGVIREAAQRVLVGESLRTITGDLQRRGVRTLGNTAAPIADDPGHVS